MTVTALCPGLTRSDFQARAGLRSALVLGLLMPADVVARAGYRAMQRGRAVVVPGLINRLLAFSVRLAPRGLTARLAWLAHRNR